MSTSFTEKYDSRKIMTDADGAAESRYTRRDPAERIAQATERTAKGVEGLRQDVKNNKPAFV